MRLFDIMTRFFKEKDFAVSPVDNSTALSMTVAGESGKWPCIAQTAEDRSLFLFYGARPQNVPEEKHELIASLISAINFKLLVGNFEMDPSDGDLRLRTSLDLSGFPEGSEMDATIAFMIERSVVFNIMTMDQFLPIINGVISEEFTLIEAMMKINQ